MMKTLVIATYNDGKLREYQNLLRDFKLNITSLSKFPKICIHETGNTFDENAILKAKKIVAETSCPALGDDSGLEVRALGNMPGIYTARYAGPGADDKDNMQKLLRELNGLPLEKRQARFVCSLVLALPDGTSFIERGFLEGIIFFEPRGTNGFGYDPIFYLPEHKKTLAELSDKLKNLISHRAAAVENMKKHLNLLV